MECTGDRERKRSQIYRRQAESWIERCWKGSQHGSNANVGTAKHATRVCSEHRKRGGPRIPLDGAWRRKADMGKLDAGSGTGEENTNLSVTEAGRDAASSVAQTEDNREVVHRLTRSPSAQPTRHQIEPRQRRHRRPGLQKTRAAETAGFGSDNDTKNNVWAQQPRRALTRTTACKK